MNTRLLLAALLLTTAPALHAADRCASFNGSNQSIQVPNFHQAEVSGEVTVEFWARAERLAQQAAFMLAPDQAANRFQASISYNSGGNTNTYWDFGNIGTNGRLFIANPPNTVGNWTHYAFVSSASGGFMNIYVNGVEAASKIGPASAFNTNGNGATGYSLHLGGGPGYHFEGRLDEFRVWNVARSQAQIQASLWATLTGSEAGLRLYCKFDEDSGTLAVNSADTGASYTGTMLNGGGRSAPARAVVTTTSNDGPGSLRRVFEDGVGYISFAPRSPGRGLRSTRNSSRPGVLPPPSPWMPAACPAASPSMACAIAGRTASSPSTPARPSPSPASRSPVEMAAGPPPTAPAGPF